MPEFDPWSYYLIFLGVPNTLLIFAGLSAFEGLGDAFDGFPCEPAFAIGIDVIRVIYHLNDLDKRH